MGSPILLLVGGGVADSVSLEFSSYGWSGEGTDSLPEVSSSGWKYRLSI
jgi:hypothetical protein